MPNGHTSLRAFRCLRRVVALGAVGLILALSWLAVDPSSHVGLHAAASAATHAHSEHTHEDDARGDQACHHQGDDTSSQGCGQEGEGSGAVCDDPGCAVVRFAAGATDPFHPQILTDPRSAAAPPVQTPSVDRKPDRTPVVWPAPSCGPPRWA